MIGPRVLFIGFDCEPLDEATVKERLKSVSPFAGLHKADGTEGTWVRWGIRVPLHPVIQNRLAKEMVGEIMRKLELPTMTFVAWHDTMEDGPV